MVLASGSDGVGYIDMFVEVSRHAAGEQYEYTGIYPDANIIMTT